MVILEKNIKSLEDELTVYLNSVPVEKFEGIKEYMNYDKNDMLLKCVDICQKYAMNNVHWTHNFNFFIRHEYFYVKIYPNHIYYKYKEYIFKIRVIELLKLEINRKQNE